MSAKTDDDRGGGRGMPPRAVVVVRATEYERLLFRHGTREQARFFLQGRGLPIDEVQARHDVIVRAVHAVQESIPLAWRRARVAREDLDRFLFEPEDVVVCVGQDGLVANAAKYLQGQIVVGVNPSRELFDGVLVRHPPEAAKDLLPQAARGKGKIEERAMVVATTSDHQRLLALNEVYVGHRTHQSSRYVLLHGGKSERHSSSGVVVATGTGATGWARSIAGARKDAPPLPLPGDQRLAFFVREAFPSGRTGTSMTAGLVEAGRPLCLRSEMNEDGVVFGDGIEEDRIELPFGVEVSVAVAETRLRLLVA